MTKDLKSKIIGYNYIPIGSTKDRPKLLMKIKIWNGEILVIDIYPTIEDYSSKEKITHQYAKRIAKNLLNIVISVPKDSENSYKNCTDIFNTLVVSTIENTN